MPAPGASVPDPVDVRPLLPGDEARAAATLGAAFVSDPILRWVLGSVPDPAERLTTLFGVLAEVYIPHGCSLVTALGDACALWLPEGVELGDEVWAPRAERLAEAFGTGAERMGELSALMHEHHPRIRPHRYLLAIGAHPRAQGGGLGSALLSRALAEVDAAGVGAYLESSSVRSRTLYERFGFRAVAELHVVDSPPLWPMWREPRPS
jgi:GNAT superfamily N-acetyltransferase